jgi:tetratricopeptide (TPR) repeat protein
MARLRGVGPIPLALILLSAVAGCETDRDGVTVNVTSTLQAYQEYVDRQPDRAEVEAMISRMPAEQLNDLGVLYESEGRLEEAEWAYQQAVWRDPRYAQAYVNLGNVLRKLGRPEEAMLRYRQAMAADPDSFAAANNFADLCAAERTCIEEAIQRLSPMLARAGAQRPYALDTLGWLNCRLGEHEKALELLEAALQEAPQDDGLLRASIHSHLAEAYDALGRREEATAHEREARRIRGGSERDHAGPPGAEGE